MREAGIRRRIAASFFLAAFLSAQLGGVAAQQELGGRPIGSFSSCERPGVLPPRCTSVADDMRHHVAFDASLTAELATALLDTMAEDYDPTDFTMVHQAEPDRLTDVIAFSRDHGENGAAGWVYCPPDAAQGVSVAGHRWCSGQELHFNLNPRYAVYLDDDGSRAYVACHELGHTVGLRHWGNPPETPGPVGETCMNADTPNGWTDLAPADVAQINAYRYVRRPPPRQTLLASAPSRPVEPFGGSGSVEALEVEHFGALDDLVVSADAVVRGRIVTVQAQVGGPLDYAVATVLVDELLAGSAPARLRLEVPLYGGAADVAGVAAAGSVEAIFFLRAKSRPGAYRLVTGSAFLADLHGVSVAFDEPSLAGLAGLAFRDALHRLRMIAR